MSNVEIPFGTHNIGFETTTAGNVHMNRSNQESITIPANSNKVIITVALKQDAVSIFGNGTKLAIDSIDIQ